MNIVLSSSLPRSGSTLLQNLLAQNPKFHCTATNDLLDMIARTRDHWMTSAGFISQGLDKIRPRIASMMRGMVYGFYEKEIKSKKTIFDKSRGWLSHIELMEEVLERKVKIISTIRDLRDVIASFEKIYRKSCLTDHPLQGVDQFRRLTVRGRAERLLLIENTVGYCVNCIQDVFERGLEDRLVIVPYYELTHNPISTVIRVCNECGLKPFTCNPLKVEQVVDENDTVYGMYDLHKIKSKVVPDNSYSWLGILPDDLADLIDKQFSFIQSLSKKRFLGEENGISAHHKR